MAISTLPLLVYHDCNDNDKGALPSILQLYIMISDDEGKGALHLMVILMLKTLTPTALPSTIHHNFSVMMVKSLYTL